MSYYKAGANNFYVGLITWRIVCSTLRTQISNNRTVAKTNAAQRKSVRFSEHPFGIKLHQKNNFGLRQLYAKRTTDSSRRR